MIARADASHPSFEGRPAVGRCRKRGIAVRFAILAALAAVVMLATTSAVSSAASSTPTGLHAFLLRADEPPTDSFHRTPSFAWDPYPAAIGYQFQLSMSSTFRENSIFYNTNTLTTPVAAPSLILPWITGSPHSLFARVRATLDNGDVTPWSDDYGFDVVPPAPPIPLSSDPGLLRWTPIEGATGYQVWLVDVPKKGQAPGLGKENVRTNVLDEREFYTFHQSRQWTSSVRWRVRALRSTELGGPTNGLPAATYGAWSAIYSSSNPAVSGGPITPSETISDIRSNGDPSSPAHRLMPAFTWSGNQTISGATAELFRVYVFTDSQCLNRVYTSAVVGSPSYAPRTGGTLALPSDSAGIGLARGAYLDDGAEPSAEMFDGTPVAAQESAAAAAPTTSAPADNGPSGSGSAPASGSSGGSAPSGGSGAPSSAGAPVDLWDTDSWPKGGGYYWTVVGVAAVSATVGASTVAAPGASKGSTLLPVSDVSQFAPGQSITIGVAPNSDTATIGAIGNGLITLSSPLNNGHAAGEPIASTASSSIIYRDLEMPQDVCQYVDPVTKQHTRVHRFGIESEPALTTAQEPFATGLSPTGRLISAARTGVFYGQPLVAWTPSLSANTYQVQWSKKSYPFTPEGSVMTPSNATVLNLGVGVWYYRVRGFDYNLPTGSQALSWSDTEKLTVAAPSFKLVVAQGKKFRLVRKSK